jgi:hypothetical protein
MGAIFNFYMLYYDPGAFAHNRRYVKRLMFDSMDWLDNGKLDKSVCDPTNKFVRATDITRKYPSLNTYGGVGISGVNDIFKYSTYLTADELKQASFYLCGSIASDHRPTP